MRVWLIRGPIEPHELSTLRNIKGEVEVRPPETKEIQTYSGTVRHVCVSRGEVWIRSTCEKQDTMLQLTFGDRLAEAEVDGNFVNYGTRF